MRWTLACALCVASDAYSVGRGAALQPHPDWNRQCSREQWQRRRVASPPQACICINCKWVDRCKTYHWVETQHEQPHVARAPDFDPTDPQIQVFIRKEDEESDVTDGADDGSTDGMTESVMTTEFDVFACDAFAEDQGKWIRLMPDADYIPT